MGHEIDMESVSDHHSELGKKLGSPCMILCSFRPLQLDMDAAHRYAERSRSFAKHLQL